MKYLKVESLLKLTHRILKIKKKNIRSNKKIRQRDADENRNSTTSQNDKIIIFFNQRLRDAETMMLRLHNL